MAFSVEHGSGQQTRGPFTTDHERFTQKNSRERQELLQLAEYGPPPHPRHPQPRLALTTDYRIHLDASRWRSNRFELDNITLQDVFAAGLTRRAAARLQGSARDEPRRYNTTVPVVLRIPVPVSPCCWPAGAQTCLLCIPPHPPSAHPGSNFDPRSLALAHAGSSGLWVLELRMVADVIAVDAISCWADANLSLPATVSGTHLAGFQTPAECRFSRTRPLASPVKDLGGYWTRTNNLDSSAHFISATN
ncbi:hypothetical protein QBC39DRAFT_382495 [Podospora conica]|nr:hypothetical protein QBC39DRAFT_382495 [Schizothecium conicum]